MDLKTTLLCTLRGKADVTKCIKKKEIKTKLSCFQISICVPAKNTFYLLRRGQNLLKLKFKIFGFEAPQLLVICENVESCPERQVYSFISHVRG